MPNRSRLPTNHELQAKAFFFLQVQLKTKPWWLNPLAACPEHPMFDQNQ